MWYVIRDNQVIYGWTFTEEEAKKWASEYQKVNDSNGLNSIYTVEYRNK